MWQTESFGYAAAKAEDGSYRGLVVGREPEVTIDGTSYLVRPDVAAAALHVKPPEADYPPGVEHPGPGSVVAGGPARTVRFSGSVALRDPSRPIPELTSIGREVLAHLASSPDVDLDVEVHVTARHTGTGFDEATKRTVTENAATLKFRDLDWEDE